MLEVTQADREAAARYWGNDNPPLELNRVMAAHRIAAERDVAEWLRMKSDANHDCGFGREAVALTDAADALERGEHKGE